MASHKVDKLIGAVVGLGSIGNRHMYNLLNLGIKKLYVVRRLGSPNNQFHPPENVIVTSTLEKAIAEDVVDFVVVSNPSALHAATATEAIQNGCHVLIEKPLGGSLGRQETELLAAAEKSQSVCAMAYCMRYHLAYLTAKNYVDDGRIGRVLYAKAWFEGYLPDWHPWEDYNKSYAALVDQGGGVLRTLDHELDFMNWVLGPALRATGKAVNTGGIGIEADDLAMYSMEHPNQVHSQVTAAFCRRPQSRGFCFVGTAGQLQFDWQTGLLKLTHKDGGESIVAEAGQTETNQMYVDLMRDFLLDIVDTTQKRSAPLEAGLHSLRIIEQISA